MESNAWNRINENSGFAAEPKLQGAGPRSRQQVVRVFIRQRYRRFLQHMGRHIREEELVGDIRAGVLDARDIVDEAVRKAETCADRKPERMTWLVWLFRLLHEELRCQVQLVKQQQVEEVPTEKRAQLPELRLSALQPMDQMVERVIEPQTIRIEDVVPNPEALPPDWTMVEEEWLEQLQNSVQSWPEAEREVFELHFVQGFELAAIEQITGQPLNHVKAAVAAVHHKLRQRMPDILARD